ncbi:MAG: hypothetical protein V2I35_04930 [Desulfocapsaceae bacterium]|jgi:hypothetical protein|nr:hypothetical protein [Desulfocapsaceae bacterium]
MSSSYFSVTVATICKNNLLPVLLSAGKAGEENFYFQMVSNYIVFSGNFKGKSKKSYFQRFAAGFLGSAFLSGQNNV